MHAQGFATHSRRACDGGLSDRAATLARRRRLGLGHGQQTPTLSEQVDPVDAVNQGGEPQRGEGHNDGHWRVKSVHEHALAHERQAQQ